MIENYLNSPYCSCPWISSAVFNGNTTRQGVKFPLQNMILWCGGKLCPSCLSGAACLFFRRLPHSPSRGSAHEARVHGLTGARTPLIAEKKPLVTYICTFITFNSYMTSFRPAEITSTDLETCHYWFRLDTRFHNENMLNLICKPIFEGGYLYFTWLFPFYGTLYFNPTTC